MITGADGYLGRRLAKWYLSLPETVVLLCVRAKDEGERRHKEEGLRRALGDAGGRAAVHAMDLRAENPFASMDPANVQIILHAAAVTRFNVDADTAAAVNVEGTAKLLRYASRCADLSALGILSTVYASGLTGGVIDEDWLEGTDGFANHYERSKWMAEQLLASELGDVPWRVFRVATVVADNDRGAVTQYNAFHNTLKLLYYGLLSLVPGKPETPLYFVTGDFVAEAIASLMESGADRAFYHVCHTRVQSATLGDLIEIAFETFMEDEAFRARRALKPLFADAESFGLLTSGVDGFGGMVVTEALASVSPFARQLFVSKEVDNSLVVSRLPGYRAPDARELIRNTCRELVRTKWGRMLRGAA